MILSSKWDRLSLVLKILNNCPADKRLLRQKKNFCMDKWWNIIYFSRNLNRL